MIAVDIREYLARRQKTTTPSEIFAPSDVLQQYMTATPAATANPATRRSK